MKKTAKQALLSFLVLTASFSCQPDEETEEVVVEEPETISTIVNLSDQYLRLVLGTRQVHEAIFIDLNPHEARSTNGDSLYVGPEAFGTSYFDATEALFSRDSLSQDYAVITFYQDSSTLPGGKNIYDSTDWILQNDTIVFQFTEEDFSNAQ